MKHSSFSTTLVVLALLSFTPALRAQNVRDSVRMTLSIFQYVNTTSGVNCGGGIVATWPNVLPNGTYASYSRVATEGMYIPAGFGEAVTSPQYGITVPDGHFGHTAHWSWSDGPGSDASYCSKYPRNSSQTLSGSWGVLNANPYRVTEWYAVFNIPSGTPIALFEWKQTTGLTVAFDGSFQSRQSHEADASAALKRVPVVSYAWDFGNGQSGSGDRPNHTYTEPGEYSVKLTVTDDDGQTDDYTVKVKVDPLALSVTVTAPEEQYEGDTFEMVARVTNEGNQTINGVMARRQFIFQTRIDPALNLAGSRLTPPELEELDVPSGEEDVVTKAELAPGESFQVRRKYLVKKTAAYRAPDTTGYVPVSSTVKWDLYKVEGKTADQKPVAVRRPCQEGGCSDDTRLPTDDAIQLKVEPGTTVTIKPEKAKSWTITVTSGKEKTALAGAVVHVRNELLEQVDEIAGATDAAGKFKYTFTAPKDKAAGEYILNFWVTKPGFGTSPITRLKVKYDIGDQIVYYECAGVPLIEFDAGAGNKFEKDDGDPDLYKRTGTVTINQMLKVDGYVEVNTRNGAENVTLNGRMYIPDIPLPGGSRGDLVFYNGPLTYSPQCENAITGLIAAMEKEVAGVKFQLQKLAFEGGMSAVALRVAGKASFQALRSSCTPSLSSPDPNNPQEEAVEIEVDMLVASAGITEFKLKTTNLGVGPSFCLKELIFEYQSPPDSLLLGGKFIIGKDAEPWFSLALKAGFRQGKLSSIEGEVEFTCMPLGSTPICIKGIKGSVVGLVTPPRSFKLEGVMTNKLNPDFFEFTMGGRYTDPAKLDLLGGLTIFKVDAVSPDNPWQAEIAGAEMKFDLPERSALIQGTLNFGHFGDKKWIFSGEGKLEMTTKNGVDFKGTAKGSFTIPDGDDVVRRTLKRNNLVLPYRLAAVDMLLDNGVGSANLDFRGFLNKNVQFLGRWNASITLNTSGLPSLSFGQGFIDLSAAKRGDEPVRTLTGAADRVDTANVPDGIANMFVGVVGDGYTPTIYLIAPDGTRYDATPADSSLILSRVQGEPQVFWLVPDPMAGKWTYGVVNVRPKDSTFVVAMPEERPFEVTAVNNGATLSVNWSASSFAGDSVRVWLDRDGEGYDGQWLGTYAGGIAGVTIPFPNELQECSYHLYALRTGPSGFSRDYAPDAIAISKNYLQAPANVVAITNHHTGRTRVTWNRSVDQNAMGYAIYVRDAAGRDSMYVAAFRDQEGATIDIENRAEKSVYIVTFDEDGRRGCPGPAASIGISDVKPSPGTQVPSSLELSAIPNPYNDQTVIGFALASPSQVTIQVHDLNGKKLATVIDRHVEAGDHTLLWNAAGIPAGVYVISITAGEKSEALMTILIR